MRKLLKALLILLAVLLAVVIIYVGYVMLSYDRIPDNQELEIRNPQETDLAVRLGEGICHRDAECRLWLPIPMISPSLWMVGWNPGQKAPKV